MIRRLWRSTFGLVALVALGLTIVTVGIGVLAFRVTHEALEKQLDHRIDVETTALLAEVPEGGLSELAAAIRRRESARSTASLEYLLLDRQGRRLAGAMIADVAIKPGYEEFFYYRRGSEPRHAQALVSPVAGGTLIVAVDRAGLQEIDHTFLLLFANALVAMLLVGIAAAGLIGWVTRRRLSQVDATALAIINGDLSRRVPRDGSNSEFDRLAAALNHMLDRITTLMDNLRQLSSDVAHDLRTPLTRLYNKLDRAMAEDEPSARLKEIDAARAEAAELLEIFSALLRISEVEGLAERPPRSELDLSTLVEQMAETYRPDMEATGHRLWSDIAMGITIAGDRRLLSQALANLLDNSIRHTPPGTAVSLSLRAQGESARLQIADNGPGAPGDPNRLLQRFARSEAARSTPGHGLGLALVAAIARAHGGSIEIVNDDGFVVTIALPLG